MHCLDHRKQTQASSSEGARQPRRTGTRDCTDSSYTAWQMSGDDMTNSGVIAVGSAVFFGVGLLLFLILVACTDSKYRRFMALCSDHCISRLLSDCFAAFRRYSQARSQFVFGWCGSSPTCTRCHDLPFGNPNCLVASHQKT